MVRVVPQLPQTPSRPPNGSSQRLSVLPSRSPPRHHSPLLRHRPHASVRYSGRRLRLPRQVSLVLHRLVTVPLLQPTPWAPPVPQQQQRPLPPPPPPQSASLRALHLRCVRQPPPWRPVVVMAPTPTISSPTLTARRGPRRRVGWRCRWVSSPVVYRTTHPVFSPLTTLMSPSTRPWRRCC